MLRLLAVFGLCLGLMTGCATAHLSQSASLSNISPMQQVLDQHPDLVRTYQNASIQQVFNNDKHPTAARVVVVETSLKDQHIVVKRTAYTFKLHEKTWQLRDKQSSDQCMQNTNKQLHSVPCK